MSPAQETTTVPVTDSTRDLTPSRVDLGVFRRVLDVCGITNHQLARATGYSASYVAQIRAGSRQRVSIRFVDAASSYLAVRLGETVVVTRLLFAAK